MPRRPSPLERLFSDLRDTLLDTAEDILDDALSAAQNMYHKSQSVPVPPTSTLPPNSHPGKRSRPSRSTSPHPTSRPRRGIKTSPGASQYQGLTLYEQLEVSWACSPETIAAAYKSLARKYHPDLPTGNVIRMQQINYAHEILSDPKKRLKYDREIGIAR